MKRPVAMALILLGALSTGFFAGSARCGLERVTLVSLSSDEALRVHLVEVGVGVGIDRNFQVRLERLASGSIETLFRSPDEGRPIGSERILWSPDSRRFVLLGRHFFVRKGTPTLGGESLYLLCDVESGSIWCNASQQSAYPHFEARDVEWVGTANLVLPQRRSAVADPRR